MIAVEPVDALLVLDVGNTRVGVGVWDCDGLHDARRVELTDGDDACTTAIREAWAAVRDGSRAAVLGSVNPTAAARIQALVEDITGQSVHRVRDDLPLPLATEIENIDEVGVDRVCCAAAAYERVQGACAVASFGTAVTVDCVSSEGRLLGGAILPGFQMGCDALHAGTAQLPRIRAGMPHVVFARNTHDAIINGVAYGLVGGLREIVERYATELREWPALVITGGNAPLIAELADFIDAIVPDLCLMGIALAYRRAAGQP